MAEEYCETFIIRNDNRPCVPVPTFENADINGIFEFEGTVRLKQIIKSTQDNVHSKHDYVFTIEHVTKLQKEGN